MPAHFVGSLVALSLATRLASGLPPEQQHAGALTDEGTQTLAAESLPPQPGWLRRLAGDFRRTFTSRHSLLVLGVGGSAALLVSPLDSRIQRSRFNSELHDGTNIDVLFEPGHYAGGAVAQFGVAVGAFAVGKLAGKAPVSELGADLLRAQIVSGGITQMLKLTTRRERPDGTSRLSFPSGHASAAFATATVLEGRFGGKVGIPAYGVAAWIAASRLAENRHFLSDVTFGAAVGIAAGRAVALGRGPGRLIVLPQVVPGQGAGLQVVVLGFP